MAVLNIDSSSANQQQQDEKIDSHEVVHLDHVSTKIDNVQLSEKSPYLEVNFIGTYAAILLGAICSYGGFVMPVTSLAYINADIGPSPNEAWVALSWTLCVAVGYTLVGRLSDIFGRRWFFIGCSLLATVGCVVAGTAQSINTLIGANVLIGFAASGQLSLNYVLGELVPVRHRFVTSGIIFALTCPIAGMGPYFSRLFIAHTSAGWRWDYYLTIILNGISTLLYVFFYHPPTFKLLHNGRTRMQELRDLDYIGLLLFVTGAVLFLLGLSWGGQLYAWSSAKVITTLVIGIVTLIVFVVWETFAPMRRPLIPMGLFRNRNYCLVTTISTVGGMLYYSMNVIFPSMVALLFTSDSVYGGLISCAIGGGVCCGQALGAFVALPGGHLRDKTIFCAICMTAFAGGVAGAGENQVIASALITLCSISVGVLETFMVTLVTIVIDDQSEMGSAAGVFGSIRSAGGVLATAIYVAILKNKSAAYITADVVPAIIKAGLPPTSVAGLLTALSSGSATAIEAVPGISTEIIGIATITIKQAYSHAFKIVFLASIPFGVCSLIAASFFTDVDNRLSHDVVRRLGKRESVVAEGYNMDKESELPGKKV